MARLRRTVAVALLAGCVVAAIAVAAGHAGATRTRSTTVASFDSGSVTAACPGRQRLLAGGVRAKSGPKKGLVIAALQPQGKRRVRAKAANVFVNDASLSATAYCARRPPTRLVSRTVHVHAKRDGKRVKKVATARCPTGTTVLLGGFKAQVSAQPTGPSVVVSTMRRSGARRLEVVGVNGGERRGSLTAIAGCGKGPPPRQAGANAALPPDGGRATATAVCPAGKHVVFGGFRTRANDGRGPYLRRLARPSPKRWRVQAFQFARAHASVRAIAYCG